MVAGSASSPGARGVTDRVPAWTLAVASMLSVQVAAALSTHLFDTIGPAGTAWLRLPVRGPGLFLVPRPRARRLSRTRPGTAVPLGGSTRLVTVALSSAVGTTPPAT